jgi:hypothetical protein
MKPTTVVHATQTITCLPFSIDVHLQAAHKKKNDKQKRKQEEKAKAAAEQVGGSCNCAPRAEYTTLCTFIEACNWQKSDDMVMWQAYALIMLFLHACGYACRATRRTLTPRLRLQRPRSPRRWQPRRLQLLEKTRQPHNQLMMSASVGGHASPAPRLQLHLISHDSTYQVSGLVLLGISAGCFQLHLGFKCGTGSASVIVGGA